MGWFDEQIKNRIRTDEFGFENSMMDLSSVILGKTAVASAINNDRQKTKNAIEEVLKYYKAKIIEIPDEIEDIHDQIDYLLRPTGIMKRTVHLTGKWWKDAIGPMIGETKNGDTVALIPHGFGYQFFDYDTNKIITLNDKTKDLLNKEAFCFYTPFPLRQLKIKDLISYVIGTLTKVDFALIILFMLIANGMNLISAPIQNIVFGKVVPSGNTGFILPVMSLLIGMTLSQTLIGISKSLVSNRVQTKLSISVTSATMNRVISLPASFFKNYNSGELASRISAMTQLCGQLSDIFLGTALPAIMSLMYIPQMFLYAPGLVLPSIIILLVQLAVATLGTLLQLRISRKSMDIGTKLNGLLFSLFSGIQKIKLGGAERRAFAKWAEAYKSGADLQYDPPFFLKIMPIISTIISAGGSIMTYYFAFASNVTLPNYISFQAAFGAISGAIMAVTSIATSFATIKPVLELAEPILNEEPEASENKKIITQLSGSIELANVTFSYEKDSPIILDDISIKIKPGQYVAIVGKTGCGKSTLMRLLLGFEKPNIGSVYFDGQDISKLEIRSLRQKIGVVMQNGKLFSGDVFANITISAPWLNKDAAWEAAELAGVAEDIRNMPMEMNTIISEGSGGISGGQRQRLMIARAIAPKPKILMLDEATSALDNITQRQVSDALAGLKSTRIVIAHRLSTIKNCDRIIMLENGKIVEDGTYNELIDQGGHFAELVKRQQVENAD